MAYKKYFYIKICSPYAVLDDKEIWTGTCAKQCIKKSIAFIGFSNLVGEPTYQNQLSQCLCQSSWNDQDKPFTYGIDCDSSNPVDPGDTCIHGVPNAKNTISGCACTNSDGEPTPYHGWFCDVPNWKLCVDGQFYTHANTNSVADVNRGCKSCGLSTNQYCKTCIQANETGDFFPL